MFWFTRGGTYGWGSICGALTPAFAFVDMLLPPAEAQPIVEEIMAWYEVQAFPLYQPDGEVVTTVAGSTLCHVSVSKWTNLTGHDLKSKEKKKRCGGISADVANKTIELLDKHFADGKITRDFTPHANVKGCNIAGACHGGESTQNVQGKENCMNCHEEEYKVFPHTVK